MPHRHTRPVAYGLHVSQDGSEFGSALAKITGLSSPCNVKRLDSSVKGSRSQRPRKCLGSRSIYFLLFFLQYKGSDSLPYTCWANAPLPSTPQAPGYFSKNAFGLDSGSHLTTMSLCFESLVFARFCAGGYREMKGMIYLRCAFK